MESESLRQGAAKALEVLSQEAPGRQGGPVVALRMESGAEVEVPTEAFDLFIRVLAQLANGHEVVLIPTTKMLTTGQAAELLSVSRPYLVGLLDAGEIEHTLVGRHRRVSAQALRDYQAKQLKQRREAADELAALAQELEG